MIDQPSDQPAEQPVPLYVDTRRVFQQEANLHGTVALERLPEFRNSLASDQAQITAELRFGIDNTGLRRIVGRVDASVELTCQRCLQPVSIQLQDKINLALVKDEEEAAGLNPDLDPWIWQDIKLQLATVVEEQLLLSLPIVCYHPEGQCPRQLDYSADMSASDDESSDSAKSNPFAVLEQLKQSKQSTDDE
jgi:uncharacterized protein